LQFDARREHWALTRGRWRWRWTLPLGAGRWALGECRHKADGQVRVVDAHGPVSGQAHGRSQASIRRKVRALGQQPSDIGVLAEV